MSSPSFAQIATGVGTNFQNYECDLSGFADGMPGCPIATFGVNAVPVALVNNTLTLTCDSAAYCGARTDPQKPAVLPIDAFGACAWVDNYTSDSLFVPFGSSTDWQDFRVNAPINNKHLIVLTDCALPYSISHSPATVNVAPYPDCITGTVAVPNIYGRSPNSGSPIAASTWSAPAQTFSCNNGATTITSNLQWIAGDSNSVGRNMLSWNQNFTYSPDIQFIATDSSNAANSGSNITVAGNTPVILSWTTTAATTCEAVGGWSNDTAVNTGNNPVTVTPTGKTTYMLECSNSVGTSTAIVTINVAAAAPTQPPAAQCGTAYVSLPTYPMTVQAGSLCATGTPSRSTFYINDLSYTCTSGSSIAACAAVFIYGSAPYSGGGGGW